jgi:hypothetical protein
MTGTDKTLHASLAPPDSSPHSQADRPMVGVREARPCPTFSLNSAEKPPKNAFSRQNCRHDGVDAEPKNGKRSVPCSGECGEWVTAGRGGE